MEKEIDNQDMDKDSQKAEVVSDDATPQKEKGGLFNVIILLLIIGLYAGGYWLWLLQQSVTTQVEQQLSERSVPAVTATVDTSVIERSLKVMETKFQSQLTAVQSGQSALVENIESFRASQQLTGADVEYDWIMAEVRYLLNIANQQALLAHDAHSAREAIALADSRVKTLLDHRLYPLRTLLSDELLALSAVKDIDIESMSLHLQSALEAIDSLQVLMANPMKSEQIDEAISSDSVPGVLSQAWQQVKSLVVIRHQQDGAAAVLVPEQRYFLYQNLRLKLESAQFALLTGNQSAFDSNLKSAMEWLQQYFVSDERDAMLALLEDLSTNTIKADMPDISASLIWLRGFEQ